MNKLIIPAFATALALGACATAVPSEPTVVSFNESSVGIQIIESALAPMSAEARAAALVKADERAQEICSRGPNRRAERTSQRSVPAGEYTMATEYLYLCLR